MSGKLTREQATLLCSILGILVVVGGIDWFGLGKLFSDLADAQEIAAKKNSSELATILSRAGGVSSAKKDTTEIAKLGQELTKTEEELVGPWRKGLEEASAEGMDWSKDPGQWKDNLVKYNDDLLKKCGRLGDTGLVALGANFYLGFEEYKQKSPSLDQVPDLARQLSVAKRLADLLIAAKKTNEGYATPCVLLALEAPTHGDGNNPESGKTNKGSAEKNSEFLRERYRLKISCSPEVLYEYVRLLTQDSWFFIVSNLALTNEKETFPKRGEVAKIFQVETPGVAGTPNSEVTLTAEKDLGKPKLLLVLSGKERLEVTLEVDYVGWKAVAKIGKDHEAKK